VDGLRCPDVLKLKASAALDEEDADEEEPESVSLLAPAPPVPNAGDDGDGQSGSEGAGVAAVDTVVPPTANGNSQFMAALVPLVGMELEVCVCIGACTPLFMAWWRVFIFTS